MLLFNQKAWISQSSRKKSTTLLLPYIIWNLIFFITFSLDKDYTVYEFIKGFWFLPRRGITGVLTQPWDGPLWFLRDLMVIFLLTPVIIFILVSSQKLAHN